MIDGNRFNSRTEKMTKSKRRHTERQRTQQLEAVGRLAGGIAHDFNNLLAVISGYNSLLRDELTPGSQAWDYAAEVGKAAERAAILTNQLLAFSRREVTQPRVLNLNEMVDELAKMLSRIVGEDIKFAIALASDLGNIKADPGQICQLMTNMVVNARDAMPAGGVLTIKTCNVQITTTPASGKQGLMPGAYVQLTISDNGVGMDEETRGRVFEPFFTTKPKGKGNGLGLSIVYGIVSQLRGEILISSELERGTEFTIYLPVTEEQPIIANKAPAVSSLASPKPARTILLVEDEDAVRYLAMEMLRKQGYTVYETPDPTEAIRICQTITIHLLLTDVVMPDINGKDLANKLLKVAPDMKILYMSGYVDDSIIPPALFDPGVNFIRKPFSAERLSHQVKALLDQCQTQTMPRSGQTKSFSQSTSD